MLRFGTDGNDCPDILKSCSILKNSLIFLKFGTILFTIGLIIKFVFFPTTLIEVLLTAFISTIGFVLVLIGTIRADMSVSNIIKLLKPQTLSSNLPNPINRAIFTVNNNNYRDSRMSLSINNSVDLSHIN
jgi:hypothetical protein